jgi:fatty-acyl-CoA synthase
MSRPSPYDQHLDRNPANYVPLSPVSFLFRTAEVYPERVAVIHGDWRLTWREVAERSTRLASVRPRSHSCSNTARRSS